MKITKKYLEKLIVEEISTILSEQSTPPSEAVSATMKAVSSNIEKGNYDGAVQNLSAGVMPTILKYLDYAVREVEKLKK